MYELLIIVNYFNNISTNINHLNIFNFISEYLEEKMFYKHINATTKQQNIK